MSRVLLCCLLALLTACASAPPQPTPTRTAMATLIATSPATLTIAATTTRAIAAASVHTCPEGLSWANCVATAEAAGASGFARAAGGATPRATPGRPGDTGAPGDEFALVVRVIDGRTIEVRLEDGQIETVRYLGVAIPEIGECYGTEASARNAALVGGRTVRLERDVSERDRTERLLRHVWVIEDNGTHRLASEELVREGYGTAANEPPHLQHRVRIAEAQREASGAGRGLLGACMVSPTPSVAPTVTPTPPPPTPTPTPPLPTATNAPPPPPPTPTQQAATATPRPPEPTTVPPTPPTATPEPPAPAPPALPTATATRVPPTATRVPTRPPPPTPTPTKAAATCHPSYPTLCLPGAPDLDCADVPQKAFPVRPPDPHRFDADKDGIGCEE